MSAICSNVSGHMDTDTDIVTKITQIMLSGAAHSQFQLNCTFLSSKLNLCILKVSFLGDVVCCKIWAGGQQKL